MPIAQQHIDQAFSDLKSTYGGVREDYFGLLYLEKEFKLPREEAANQNAFGGDDYGIDGFHIDTQRRNLYLFQFKWSRSHHLFKQSMERLIQDGMNQIFGNVPIDRNRNQMLFQLKSKLYENQAVIDRVLFHFVFNGDPEEAERSQVLDKLREDLEGKKFLIEECFKRKTEMAIQFRNAMRVGATERKRVTHVYPVDISDVLEREGPDGELMSVGFIRLQDLNGMYSDMQQRFFERNIRAALNENSGPNRAISRALKEVVLDESVDPSAFAFHHNGVTLFAEKFEESGGKHVLTEPRLLNGAQTVTTFAKFLQRNEENPRLRQRKDALGELRVLCKIITNTRPEFATAVAINNNRQNPVMPWNLRANDMIQLELQDFFRENGFYYERQENAFAALTREDLEDLEIPEGKAIELLRLAKTILASDGEVANISRMTEVFENDRIYNEVFRHSLLRSDHRKVILCYKIQFRLARLINEIMEKGERKYEYVRRARNLLWALLCQAVLNDKDLEAYAERHGSTLVVEADFTDWLARLSSTRVRFIISELVEKEPYATMLSEERYDFFRTKRAYEECMKIAYRKYKWLQKHL